MMSPCCSPCSWLHYRDTAPRANKMLMQGMNKAYARVSHLYRLAASEENARVLFLQF